MNRAHRTIVSLLIAVAGLTAGVVAFAQQYPTKPVRIVVGFAPGGVADITVRIVAQKLSERLKQQFVVENRPSAGGIIAAEAVAKAAPDGYTLLLISNGNAVSVSLFKKLSYDPVKDFAMVSQIGYFGLAIVTGNDSKLKTVKDVITAAKANPGKLTVGTIGIGSTQHLSAELFKSLAGVDMTVVPFKGSSEVLTALKGGDLQLGFEILAPVMAQVKGGGLRAIAVTTKTRFPGLPDVPTVIESGVPGYEVASWNGIAAPASTPRPVVDVLNKEINAVLALPEVKQRFDELGVVPQGGTPEELGALLAKEIAKWKDVVAKAKIEKQ
ncbi:MAG TPA: tripartite tricarboxylate transporter substrate binding protein [Burkholderiales bacterium]|nr:tripartite tricarboxylate transporter substrate binding protein [Burkholderiales bacterium]